MVPQEPAPRARLREERGLKTSLTDAAPRLLEAGTVSGRLDMAPSSLSLGAGQASAGTLVPHLRVASAAADRSTFEGRHGPASDAPGRAVESVAAPAPLGSELARLEGVLTRAEATGSEQLSLALARQVLSMSAQSLSQLRVQLNPEELGHLDIRLRVDGERVHVAIVTQQTTARDLLEVQLPQLRQLLEDGGLELGDVDVRQHGSGGERREQRGEFAAGPPDTQPAVTERQDAAPSPVPQHDRLIDAFA